MSIALVIASHALKTAGLPHGWSLAGGVDWGAFGVQVFFVLSGYLITRLLLAEWDRAGAISLAGFYVRRVCRILPPFYAYLLVVALLAGLGVVAQPARGLALGATFLTNYVTDVGWFVGHSWSLSVEEQFYLLWPAALVLSGRRRGWVVAAAVVLVVPVLRIAAFHRTGGVYGFDHHFETTADALAVGCLFAFFGPRLWPRVRALGLPSSAVLLGAAVVAVFASSLGQHPHVYLLAGQTVASLGIALVILTGVNDPGCAVGRVLEWRPLKSVGLISYSLYLWQQLFLGPGAAAWGLTGFGGALLGVAASLLSAYASYRLIEGPSHRLRDLVMRRPGRRALPGVAPRA